jgi:hypothetical protein
MAIAEPAVPDPCQTRLPSKVRRCQSTASVESGELGESKPGQGLNDLLTSGSNCKQEDGDVWVTPQANAIAARRSRM